MFKHTRISSAIFFIIVCPVMVLVSWYCSSTAYCAGNDTDINFMDEKPLYPGYPVMFDIRGKISRISDSEIVINDTLFKLDETVSFITPYDEDAGISQFKEKDIVGAKLGTDRQIISIWLIKKYAGKTQKP
jgi:hypothetical protein